jgi:predicted dehydrogenase
LQRRETANVLLIGCGPHAKRVYLPALEAIGKSLPVQLKAIVELESNARQTEEALRRYKWNNINLLYTPEFTNPRKMPDKLEKKLDEVVKIHEINAVIITTEPLAHMQYSLWALKHNLHILMDKPISTRRNIAKSQAMAREIFDDFVMLLERHDMAKAFIVNAQRRYHPGFNIVRQRIKQLAQEFHIPITSMQSMHCDGQWRLPKEIITQDYHPYNSGYGKVSHSGYHIIDAVASLVSDSFLYSGKSVDKVGVFSSFVKPAGLLSQQNRNDYLEIFGNEYNLVNEHGDIALREKYQNFGEVDSMSAITLFNGSEPTANISINLMHNGFARRDWILPGNDLYKGNGRVKHEYHNIQQGPFQNIQIHSYQSKDKQESNDESDFLLGGNNHFEIYIFRNRDVVGGELLEVISSKDIAASVELEADKLLIEQTKHAVVKEFVEIILGKREPANSASDLSSHGLSVKLMSLIYQSGAKRKEIMSDLR